MPSTKLVLAAYKFSTSELNVAAREVVAAGINKIESAKHADVTRRRLDAWLAEKG